MPRVCATGPHQGWQPDPHSPDVLGYINDGIDDWKNIKSAKEHDEKSGRKPIPDEDGNIIMHHWSNTPGLKELDPTKQGTGLRGSNFRAGYGGKDQILYSSYGLNVGHPLGYKKEAALGGVEYISKMPIERIYDIELDPKYFRVRRDKIIAEKEAKHNAKFNQGGGPQIVFHKNRQLKDEVMVQLIKDAGYAGFFMANDMGYGLTASIWEPTVVEQVKPGSEALATSNTAKFESMKLGWDITTDDIKEYRSSTDSPNFKQDAELKKLANKKNKENPKVNLDEDYEWASTVIKNSKIETLDAVQKIPTFREIIAGVGKKVAGKLIRQGGGKGYIRIDNNQRVKSRLDIPAYENTDTWVVTVHGLRGGVIGYAKSAVLNDVKFGEFNRASKKVAMGGGKSTFATMEGAWVDLNERQAEQMANDALNNIDGWAEVGMNPNRYGYFYIKETGQKIISSPRVVQVGPLVMADLNGAKIKETPHSELMAQSGIDFRRSRKIRRLARQYKMDAGIRKDNLKVFKPLNKAFGARVAMAYDAMKHNPRKPEVAEAYDALLNETLEQYKYILNAGLQVEFIPSGQKSPYSVPSEAVADILDNNHMWVYSTVDGYGDGQQNIEHPLLAPTEFTISGQVALANDIFRVVHDYFGHAKNQVGFRAEGEESAFISHSNMYSDTAVKALASETRGQNSWVNFGPFAEQNRTASEEDTVYAPQKAGLLPEKLRNPKNPPA
jgi:hypothetical protein